MAPSKLVPWFEVRVLLALSALQSPYPLSRRRTLTALAQWKGGAPPLHHRYVDTTGGRELSGPGAVDWSGFPIASTDRSAPAGGRQLDPTTRQMRTDSLRLRVAPTRDGAPQKPMRPTRSPL
jgi:hypothetical protein